MEIQKINRTLWKEATFSFFCGFLNPNYYSCQIFQEVRLFQGGRLFRSLEFRLLNRHSSYCWVRYYAWNMRALRSQCFSPKMNGLNPEKLKKSKSWDHFRMYVPVNFKMTLWYPQFFQKTNKTWGIIVLIGQFFSFVRFWEELKSFWNNWPLISTANPALFVWNYLRIF